MFVSASLNRLHPNNWRMFPLPKSIYLRFFHDFPENPPLIAVFHGFSMVFPHMFHSFPLEPWFFPIFSPAFPMEIRPFSVLRYDPTAVALADQRRRSHLGGAAEAAEHRGLERHVHVVSGAVEVWIKI